MFTSSYGSRRFAAWDQGSRRGFFSTQICIFSRPVCLGYYEKSRDICAFWSDELINNCNVFSYIKITLRYSVYSTRAHQVRKYAYRIKQNVFNRFDILI